MPRPAHIDGYTGPEDPRIRDWLIRIGARAKNGAPHYRLVMSDRVFEQRGGRFHDWDENLDAGERTPVMRKVVGVIEKVPVPKNVRWNMGTTDAEMEVVVEKSVLIPGHRPTRIVTEMRTLPKYSHLDTVGWILERWYSPRDSGMIAAEWESIVVPGSQIPALGPFPKDGFYEMIAGIFPKVPSVTFLQQFIHYQTKWGRDAAAKDVRTAIYEKIRRLQKTEEKMRDELHARIRDLISPLAGTTLEAGRWRNEVAKKAGITSHMGS